MYAIGPINFGPPVITTIGPIYYWSPVIGGVSMASCAGYEYSPYTRRAKYFYCTLF